MDESIAEEFRSGPLLLDGILNTHKPDILDTISNLSNDEVFTPPRMANLVLDLLPTEIWSDPEIRILDPFCKTGVFLREAARRLIVGLADVIPDEAERRAHIFRNQLFGVAITELTWLMSRRSLYGTKDASSDIAAHLTTRMDRPEGNIIFPHRTHDFDARGKCRICGVGRDIERQGRDNHAYALIHGGLEEEFGDMQFDVIIGNPPYQVKDGGHGSSSTPIYQLFVQAAKAKAQNPRFLCMIIPARWYAGGKGLDDFRAEMLSDKRIKIIVDHPDSKDCFPGVDVAGGICYFSRDRDHDGKTTVINAKYGFSDRHERYLDTYSVFIRENDAVGIIDKISKSNKKYLSEIVSSRKPFGLSTSAVPMGFGELTLRWREGYGAFPLSMVTSGKEIIDKWKVITSRASYDHAGQPGKDGKRRVLGKVEILPPSHVCSETYLVLASFNDKLSAERMVVYAKTKLFRFLLSIMANTHDFNKEKFSYVPSLIMNQDWTDEYLYDLFGINDEEQTFINSMIREM